MNGDKASLAVFAAAIIIFAFLACVGFLKSLFEHPWLLVCVALAIVAFILARRAERRERGPHDTRPSGQPPRDF